MRKLDTRSLRTSLTYKYLDEESQMFRGQDTLEWVPLDHPYQEGYFFTLELNEGKVKTLPEDMEARLRSIYKEFITEMVSMEKRPSWKKHWNVVDDIITLYGNKKKKEPDWTDHMFCWFYAVKGENGAILPQFHGKKNNKEFFIKEILPFCQLETWEETDWRGNTVRMYAYVLDKKWRKYFQFRRYNRMITHRCVKNGAMESRANWLNKRLWSRDLMAFQYGGYDNGRDEDWITSKTRTMEKILNDEFRKGPEA